jgi:uncharacterized SAM-binding protein YcdF (DUF218 family)
VRFFDRISPNGKSGTDDLALKRIFVRFCVLFTIATLIVQFSPLVRWYARALAGSWNDPDGDILIVLSADEQPDDMVGPVSYGRAIYAVRAWRAGHFHAVVISGGRPKGTHLSLAAVIGQFLAAYGVPKDRIFLEERSISTRENALFTKEMISSWPGRKVLLTSDAHMFRARRVFEAAGLPVAPRPVPDILKRFSNPVYRIPDAWSLFVETGKIAWYWQRGWIHRS